MHIVVIGSAAMDLVVTASKRPIAGETIIGDSFALVPGGKGANQAVACARLGAQVTFLGCVGDDHYAKLIIENLVDQGVNTQSVQRMAGTESGTAHITLAEGDNSIIVLKGANNHVSPSYIEKESLRLNFATNKPQIVLIQQEIPEDTVAYVANLCYELSIPLILNPAPARALSEDIISKVSYLTPNEHEASVIFDTASYKQVLAKFPNKLVVTEGAKGVRYHNGETEQLVAGYKVQVVDTTGAGDTFNGAFAYALASGDNIREALVFANKSAAISVTKFGAQGGWYANTRASIKL